MLTEERLKRLVSETKGVGMFFYSAVCHPANYPELENIESLNGERGLLVACNLKYKQTFLFHESQMHRITR